MEVWKDIEGYEGLYQISTLGRVKSLSRIIDKKYFTHLSKEIIKKPNVCRGYLIATLFKDCKPKRIACHILVAKAFLNHRPEETGLVINHINFKRDDNRLENLEIVTHRENSNQKHLKSTSKYVGVVLRKNGKWSSRITFGRKQVFLGYFDKEYDAHIA